jgi:uncharacterized membrane-anchored protein
MSPRAGLAIAVALQTVALFAIVGMKQWTLNTGTPVLLETRPVDPRSLFRGDYVVLRYAISTLDTALPGMSDFGERTGPIYVTLRQDGEFWKAVSVHAARPEPASGDVVMRGEIRYFMPKARSVEVLYGIEEYFVPEGEGRAIEQPRQDGKVSIQAAVDRFGKAGIKAVLIDGVVRYEEKLF